MFTGIIKELGTVRSLDAAGNIYKLGVSCRSIVARADIGGSVAVSGVCLTVTRKDAGTLFFDVMAETLRKTTLSGLKSADAVNLEGSLKAGGGLDGHFVLGHVDCVGTVKEIAAKGDEYVMEITFSEGFGHLLVEKGSVTVDGISLTVGEAMKGSFRAYLIPHTLAETTLGKKRSGSRVNLEFDIIGKYVAKLHAQGRPGITEEFLKANGFR